MTEEELQAIALEIAEAVPAIRKFAKLTSEEKVVVVRHLLDMQIGTDATAVVTSVAGMPPALVESVTDPVLVVAANAFVKFILGADDEPLPEQPEPGPDPTPN